jgi:hypothetical protein
VLDGNDQHMLAIAELQHCQQRLHCELDRFQYEIVNKPPDLRLTALLGEASQVDNLQLEVIDFIDLLYR